MLIDESIVYHYGIRRPRKAQCPVGGMHPEQFVVVRFLHDFSRPNSAGRDAVCKHYSYLLNVFKLLFAEALHVEECVCLAFLGLGDEDSQSCSFEFAQYARSLKIGN